jgi:small-conductance mechanosensitive channel
LEALVYTLSKPRVIGDSTFTFSSVLVFLISIYLAFYFSQFITRTIEPNENYQNDKKRNSIGSYMLLIRFFLILVGFLLGLNASGIPLTQFTVVMGALGVGIGFGLQNIFNNLVSGLIIAFEKPISVGDLIEVGEETGKVKSIGIRATIINTGDGADILIPNGKLLSSEVKNWTLSSPDKLAHAIITVANENDPELVQSLIFDAIQNHAAIVKKEKATAVIETIGNTGMQFHIRFWVIDIPSIEKIKGEIMNQVYKAFKKNNITYPNVHLNL